MGDILIDGQPLLVRGGMQTYVRELLNALSLLACEHNFTVAAPRDLGDRLPPGLGKVAVTTPRMVWPLIGLPWAARRSGAELIHATKHAGPVVHPGRLVITLPDLMYFTFPHLWRAGEGEYWRLMTRISVPRADGVIFISEQSRQDGIAMGLVRPDNSFTVPLAADAGFHPIEDDDTLNAVRQKYDLHRPYILTVSTIGPKKNFTTLVSAFARYREMSGEDTVLVVVGRDSGGKGKLEKLIADLGLSEHVRFTGWVEQRDLPAIYCGAELFAFTSVYEGFGLPPLEAMQCGVPVVSSREGALAEVVEDAALTLDSPTDIEELAHKLALVLDDSQLRRQLRQRGLERATHFSWERTARETLAVYERVMA